MHQSFHYDHFHQILLLFRVTQTSNWFLRKSIYKIRQRLSFMSRWTVDQVAQWRDIYYLCHIVAIWTKIELLPKLYCHNSYVTSECRVISESTVKVLKNISGRILYKKLFDITKFCCTSSTHTQTS